MGLIKPVPIWAYLLLAVAAWGAWGHYKSNKYEKERAEIALESERFARKAEDKKRHAAREVEAAYARNLKSARDRERQLDTANAGLLSQLNSTNSTKDATAICGVDGERGRVLERLLEESAGLAKLGAAEVERLGAKTTALQDHIKRVCVSTENADHKD